MENVTLTPQSTSLKADVSGDAYDYVNVYQKVAPPQQKCYGGLRVFDSLGVSHAEVLQDGNLYAKIFKGSGSTFNIPFNNIAFNGYGIGLVADGQNQELLFVFYKNGDVWVNSVTSSFVAPSSSFVYPTFPNHAPDAKLDNYTGMLVAHVTNEKDNCPFTTVVTKDGQPITPSNVQALCGPSASMQIESFNTILFNVVNAGTYLATITNSGGTGTSSPVVIPAASSVPTKGKGKK